MTIIKPNEQLKEFSILPPGKVPNMTLLHTNDSQYELVVSKNSRLVKNFINEEQYSKPEENELAIIKEEHEKLKAVHFECLKQISDLKDEINGMNKERADDDQSENTRNDANLLLDG